MNDGNQGSWGPPPAGGFGAASPAGGGIGPMNGPSAGRAGRNGLAVGALVTGILAIPGACCCYLSIPLGAAAILMGIVALSRIKDAPQERSGRQQALAGVICGGIALALTVAALIVGFGLPALEGLLDNHDRLHP